MGLVEQLFIFVSLKAGNDHTKKSRRCKGMCCFLTNFTKCWTNSFKGVMCKVRPQFGPVRVKIQDEVHKNFNFTVHNSKVHEEDRNA